MFRKVTIGIGFIAAMAAAPAMANERLVFLTGSPGGSWFPLGGAIKAAVEDIFDDVVIQVRPGGGLANIKAIELGRAQLALSNTISAVDASFGRAPFEGPTQNICNVAYLYPQVIQAAVTDMDIVTMSDFVGKRLAVVPTGATAEQVARLVLSTVDMSYDDLGQVNFASMSDQVNMMKDGQVDGFFQTTGIPAGVIMDVGASRDLRLLPIDDEMFAKLKEANAGFSQITIPASAYPFMTEPVQTAGFATHIIADCNVSEETIYKVTQAVHDRLGDLGIAVAAVSGTTTDELSQDVGIKQHPGAAKFFAENQ